MPPRSSSRHGKRLDKHKQGDGERRSTRRPDTPQPSKEPLEFDEFYFNRRSRSRKKEQQQARNQKQKQKKHKIEEQEWDPECDWDASKEQWNRYQDRSLARLATSNRQVQFGYRQGIEPGPVTDENQEAVRKLSQEHRTEVRDFAYADAGIPPHSTTVPREAKVSAAAGHLTTGSQHQQEQSRGRRQERQAREWEVYGYQGNRRRHADDEEEEYQDVVVVDNDHDDDDYDDDQDEEMYESSGMSLRKGKWRSRG